MLGVAYKGGTSDMRESPALKIIDLLVERGAEVALPRPVRAGASAGTGCVETSSREPGHVPTWR